MTVTDGFGHHVAVYSDHPDDCAELWCQEHNQFHIEENEPS
jgi:hypothetical protein